MTINYKEKKMLVLRLHQLRNTALKQTNKRCYMKYILLHCSDLST